MGGWNCYGEVDFLGYGEVCWKRCCRKFVEIDE